LVRNEAVIDMQKIKLFWDSLPKTVKVFFYMVLSTCLAEALIELKGIQQTYIIRVLAQLINLGIVFLEDIVPEIKKVIK
jgi:hypothetical protein